LNFNKKADELLNKLVEEPAPEKKKQTRKRKSKQEQVFTIPTTILSTAFVLLSGMEAKLLKNEKWVWSKEQADEFAGYFNAYLDTVLPDFLNTKPELTAMLICLGTIHLNNYFKPDKPIELVPEKEELSKTVIIDEKENKIHGDLKL
tara:strand:+ start:184 stop:624 length:441 start_codon:yes stop_codon:yes gene_type:complete